MCHLFWFMSTDIKYWVLWISIILKNIFTAHPFISFYWYYNRQHSYFLHQWANTREFRQIESLRYFEFKFEQYSKILITHFLLYIYCSTFVTATTMAEDKRVQTRKISWWDIYLWYIIHKSWKKYHSPFLLVLVLLSNRVRLF